ncbi:M1 family aminopeptidase [Lewinella sp. LCG006]|uniref:ABC transporter permease/M1 family aminopeptidase n=1 Tax=Lewinella sp. LCG006 TaxID=3231911 RepID=UPI00345F5DA0
MFLQLLSFEAYYQSRQRTLLLFALLFLGLGVLLTVQGYASPQIMVNGPFQIAFHTALFSLAVVFPLMFFTVSGVLRDQKYDFVSLVDSSPIGAGPLFWSRYLGVIIFGVLAISPFLLGGLLGEVLPLQRAGNQWGEGALSYYVAAWFWFIIPNNIICGSVIFVVAHWSRNALATYATAVGIYALYWICALFLNAPLMANATPPGEGQLMVAALADPFGISAFFEQTQSWTIYQKNHDLLHPEGYLLYNRLLWLGFSLCFVVVGKMKRPTFLPQRKPLLEETAPMPAKAREVSREVELVPEQWWPALRSMLRIELQYVFGSLPYLAILGIWVVIVFTEIYSRVYSGGSYGEQLYPSTGLLLWLIRDPLPWLSSLLLVFYSGELVWRERALNVEELINTGLVKKQSLLLSKWLCLILLPLSLMITSILLGLGFQVASGYYTFEPGLYLSLFYYEGLPLLFYSLLALFIQVVSPKKYLGMLLTFLLIIVFQPTVAARLGLHHPLLQPGGFPEVVYTDMNGYGDYSKGFHYLAVHWLLLGLLLGGIAWQAWLSRTNGRRTSWPQGFTLVFLVLLGLWIVSGGCIYHQVNIEGDYLSPKTQLDFQEAYERKFKKWDQPHRLFPKAIDTKVDLYTAKGAYRVWASYLVENKSDTAVTAIFVSERVPLESFVIDGGTLVDRDTFFHTRLYKLAAPLCPGDTLRYTYELYYQKKGFAIAKGLVANGSYLMRNEFDPVLNYRPSLEIRDEKERIRRGLPLREEIVQEEASLHLPNATVGKIHFNCFLSTSGQQTAIAPGNLVNHWSKGGRNYYHYQSKLPTLPMLNYFSAHYEIDQSQYKGLKLEFYYHPAHGKNLSLIKDQTKLALDYCQHNFGAYPLDHLRIAEIPGHWPFGGQAMAGTISMVENRLFMIDTRASDAFNLVAKRTIHEVAHQWWGGSLCPKNVAGSAFLLEGLAKYTEAIVMEKSEGLGAVWQLSKTAQQQYFQERSLADKRESPLFLCQNESYLAYGKGFIAMLALRELLGEQRMNLMLRTLLEQHSCEVNPSFTSLDFLEALYTHTSPSDTVLINDWLKRRITYDLEIEKATIKERQDGRYEVTATIKAQRHELMPNGELRAIGLEEPIVLGLFKQAPQHLRQGEKPLLLTRFCLETGTQVCTVITDQRPSFVIVDPFGSRLEAVKGDNQWKF